jgi:arylsulfatase A-like enzyme
MSDSRLISTRQRPRVLAGLLAGLTVPMIGRGRACGAEAPDIVVLVMNDARNGDQAALPRTMDWLASQGTTYPNFFLTTPLCCPSRASILTGLYAHNHGVSDNRAGWEAFAQRGNRDRTTGVLLRAAGYRTAALGTYLNGTQPGRGLEPGWDIGPIGTRRKKKKKKKGKGKGGRAKRQSVDSQSLAYESLAYQSVDFDEVSFERRGGSGKGDKKNKKNKKRRKNKRGGYDDWGLAGAAAGVIAETPPDQPLYLHVGFGTPHVPVNPSAFYLDHFGGEQVARDPSFNESDIGDKPKYVRNLRGLNGGDQGWLDDLHRRRLGMMLALDDAIARIREALEARGRLDNTYVFLMTDNGYLMGQHRLYGKIAPYDLAARMPLYAFGPGFAAGAVDNRLVGNIDIAPTLVEVAAAGNPGMDGVSLLSSHDRDAILLELMGSGLQSMEWPGPRTEIPRYSGVRTADHLYVEYQGGERELYDYAADPFEVQNLLAGTPTGDAHEIANQLAARLSALRGCGGSGCV